MLVAKQEKSINKSFETTKTTLLTKLNLSNGLLL